MALVDLKSDLTWYGTPPSVNYLSDKESGATGFTDSVNATQYIGVANDSYTYPVTVRGGRLMQPKSAAKFPGPQNFIDNRKSGARGFTLDMDKLPREDKSEFLGIYNSSYSYPNSVLSGRLMQPAGTSRSGPIVRFRGPQNFFDDKLSGAKGFTLNMDKLPRPDKSEFIGIRGLNYRYPTTLLTGDRLMKPRLSTSFPGPQNFFADVNATGFTENMWKPGQSKKPSQFVGINGDTYTYPSNLVDKFNEFNLQSNSYNTNDTIEFRQPFIVRGMQRPGQANGEAQRWGSTIDDGLIRGGAVTTASRIAADVSRITKFLGTVKGRLWIIKQFGLGRSNPKVETMSGSTRNHLGVTSLLSVAGSPLGLHFTRHGIPGLNGIDDYEKVQNVKRLAFNANNILPISSNRLVSLSGKYRSVNLLTRLGNTRVFGLISKVVEGVTGFPGLIPMSGIGGPQSVYGVGYTGISRKVDTITDAVNNARYDGYTPNYTIAYQYASLLHGYKTTALAAPAFGQAIDNVDNNELSIKSIFESKVSNEFGTIVNLPVIAGVTIPQVKIPIPNATPGNGEKDISNASNVYAKGTVLPDADVRKYSTLAYGTIPKNKSDKSFLKGDFRNGLSSNAKSFSGKGKDYATKNLETTYGFGDLGKVGADRTNPDSFGKKADGSELKGSDYKGDVNPLLDNKSGFRGDKINAIDIHSPGETGTVNPSETKDLIKFFFEDGQKGTNVMLFRAILTGLTDSFSPGWDKIDIMGRPDGAYIYTSFERTVSFNFTVAAMSRGEMIPLWRKLNYLSTYTMPNLQYSGTTKGRVSGPFMRMTLGDMYNRVPGFISSLSYTVPDESSWDIAEGNNGKQLPMIVEVAVSYTVVHDYRPQLKGKAFSIYEGNDDWLTDSSAINKNNTIPAPVTSDQPIPGAAMLPANNTYSQAFQ